MNMVKLNPTVKLDILSGLGEGRGRAKGSNKETETSVIFGANTAGVCSRHRHSHIWSPVPPLATSFPTSTPRCNHPTAAPSCSFLHHCHSSPARRRRDPFRHNSPPQSTSVPGPLGYNTKAYQFHRTVISQTPPLHRQLQPLSTSREQPYFRFRLFPAPFSFLISFVFVFVFVFKFLLCFNYGWKSSLYLSEIGGKYALLSLYLTLFLLSSSLFLFLENLRGNFTKLPHYLIKVLKGLR